MPKLKWRVGDVPTGRYRSFEYRAWPSAEYENGDTAGFISCVEEYIPTNVKTGNHPELSVYICFRKLTNEEKKKHGLVWNRKLAKKFATLAEAKKGLQDFLDKNPDIGVAS
jgi:hypothetical protein